MRTIVTKNFEETRELGVELAAQLRGGEIITLEGELGAGKTTFMQGFAKGLGITKNILSPTFIIMRSYAVPDDKKIKMLYHVDLYRIEEEKDIQELGLIDVMGNPDTIVAIEWPEKMGDILPKDTIHIKLEYRGENERKITIH